MKPPDPKKLLTRMAAMEAVALNFLQGLTLGTNRLNRADAKRLYRKMVDDEIKKGGVR